jgi:hypothetical protein
VYVELEATPLIWRISDDFSIHDHTGKPAHMQRCLLDEHGHLYLQTNTGFGLVHTMDMACAANAVEQNRWHPLDAVAADLPSQFGYVPSPQTLKKQ